MVICRQIESQKLTFRENAKARTDHGADIVAQTDSSPRRLDASSSGNLNSAEAPPLNTLADQVIVYQSLVRTPPPAEQERGVNDVNDTNDKYTVILISNPKL